MFTANLPIIADIIKYITILFTVIFPFSGLTLQVLFKPLSWLTWFRLLFIWNSVYWFVVIIPEYTRISQPYIEYSTKGRLILFGIFLLMVAISVFLVNIKPKLELPRMLKIK